MDADGPDIGMRPAKTGTAATMKEMAPESLTEDQSPLTPADYEAAHGEPLATTLDLSTWLPGNDLSETYARLEREVADAVRKEGQYQQKIREKIFPLLRARQGAPPCAGVFNVTVDRLEEVHRKILFNGAV